jgi:hypothetical protein
VDDGGHIFSLGPARSKQGIGSHHGRQLEGAEACYQGHEKRRGLTLHDQEVEGSSFYKLTTKETIDGLRVTTARLCQSSMTVGATSSGAPALRFTPTVVVLAGAPPPSIESVREVLARQIDDGGLKGKRRLDFCKKIPHEGSPIYRGFDTHT